MFQAIPDSHNTNVLAYSGHPNQPHLISCSRHSSLSRASFFTVRSSSIKSVRREVSSPLVCSRSLDRCCNRDCRSDTSPSCAWVRREICPKEHQQDLVILSHPSRHHEGSHLMQDQRWTHTHKWKTWKWSGRSKRVYLRTDEGSHQMQEQSRTQNDSLESGEGGH